MNSAYCNDIEVERAMKRHEDKDARVIPILLRSVDWEGSLFGKLEPLPKDYSFVESSKWKYIDEAFTEVAKGVKEVVVELTRKLVKTQK
jgi:hypothetical protein